MPSDALKRAAIKKAEAILKAAEVRYAIVDPDEETVYGALKISKKSNGGAGGTRNLVNDWIAEVNYIEKIKNLPMGEILIIDITNPEDVPTGTATTRANSFAAVLSSYIRRYELGEKLVTVREGGHFEILRVS